MTSKARAQRLIDEFHEGSTWHGGFSVRHGLALALRHLADAETDPVVEGVVPIYKLENLASALEAPTLFDRAMAGDKQAARQFLHESGFTDASSNWLPHYQPLEAEQ